MAYKRSTRTGYSDLNITNLVDVIFCLLIVFMVTAPLMTQGVKVDLPKVNAANIEEREAIRVSIDRKRNIFIDEDKVSLFDFDKEFRRVFTSAKTPVVLNSDRVVPYGFVVEVINKLQKLGVERLSFLTESTQKEQDGN